MSSEIHLRKYISVALILCLIVLSVIIVKPIFLAIITGLLLGYIFRPLYNKILSFVKERNISALIIIFLVFLIIFLPLWFLFPVISQQVFDFFIMIQKVDLVSFMRRLFADGVFNEVFYANLSAALSALVGKAAGGFSGTFSNFLFDLPTLILEGLIVLFSLFYSLKDSKNFGEYIKSISPFTEKTEQKLMSEFKNITNAVIYGSIIVSVVMGILIGIGLFAFKVPSALLLTFVAILFGIIPILGIWMVWVPASIYLISNDHVGYGVALAIYAVVVTIVVEGILRTYYISKNGKMHTAIGLIGMVGGLFAFGILGFILGPLILSYLIVLFEAYRKKELSSLFE
ncbi:MAG: AI-2E family transporter [Nanoarchaeota archaeon]